MTFNLNLKKTVAINNSLFLRLQTFCSLLAVATVNSTSPMDSEYQQFQFPATSSFSSRHFVNLQTGKTPVGPCWDGVVELLLETHLDMCAGVKRTLVYVPYGLLLLLLFILLLLTGIKCTWSKHKTCWFTSLLFVCSTSLFSPFLQLANYTKRSKMSKFTWRLWTRNGAPTQKVLFWQERPLLARFFLS